MKPCTLCKLSAVCLPNSSNIAEYAISVGNGIAKALPGINDDVDTYEGWVIRADKREQAYENAKHAILRKRPPDCPLRREMCL